MLMEVIISIANKWNKQKVFIRHIDNNTQNNNINNLETYKPS